MTEREKRIFALAKESLGKDIFWNDDPSTLLSAIGTKLPIDAVGKDAEGRTIIVEVKTKAGVKNPNNRRTNNRDAGHKVVGQILDYATAYMEQHHLSIEDLRLITVVETHPETVEHSTTVKKICQFLCEQGISIEHISVGSLL